MTVLRFLVCFLIENLLLNNILAQFLLQLHRRLVYWESLLTLFFFFFGINQSYSFNSFSLPCLEYCSPVWCSAADSHLRLLDRNLNAIRFLIQGLSVDLWYPRSIRSFCMLFKICRNPKHPLYSDLPGWFCPACITRGSLSFSNLAFSVVRFKTTQFSRSFIQAVTRLWSDLPNHVVESVQLQNFQCGANSFLLSRLFF